MLNSIKFKTNTKTKTKTKTDTNTKQMCALVWLRHGFIAL